MSVKRLNYFNGQLLTKGDFTDQYDYLRSMRQRHNTGAHTYGVVKGLAVTLTTGSSDQVDVEDGWAIDILGREIILTGSNTTKTISGTPPFLITCTFKEAFSDSQAETVTGIEGDRRIIESANIEVVNSASSDTLVLAEISGNTVDGLVVTDKRRFSGMNLPGDLTVQGNLEVQGDTTLIQADQMRGNVILGDDDTDTVTVEGTMVTGHGSGKLEIGSSTNVTGDLSVTGTITGDIAVGSVQAADLVDDAVTSVKLREADGTSRQTTNTGSGVKTNHIQNDAVTNVKLANDSVDTAKIAAAAVGSSELAANSVTATAIAANAVGSSQLAANSVTASEIAAGAVGNSELANNSVNAAKIADGTVGTAELANDSVNAAKLDSSTQFSLLAGFVSFNNLGNILNSFGVTSVSRIAVGQYSIKWVATGASGPYVCQTHKNSLVSLIRLVANACTVQVTDLGGSPIDNTVHVFAAPSVPTKIGPIGPIGPIDPISPISPRIP